MKNIDLDEVMSSVEEGDYCGFCIKCGEYHAPIEPDATKCKCDSCGEFAVYGNEEILFMSAF